ncbi:MAG: endonuclease NucS [Propionibacteriaceae bacterium]|jgi:RecB family endonuclease NucS|nr:endonuclease NucS [Propionibacteriaceae bacterium]
MRLVIARCQVDYAGRLAAHLPLASRLILIKADGSVQIHADDRSCKPLNWMSAPCVWQTALPDPASGLPAEVFEVWHVRGGGGDTLQIAIAEIVGELDCDLGVEPGLQKDGVEKHLQELLAANPAAIRPDLRLVQREYATAIGPVDLLCRAGDGAYVAVEIKRRGEIDGVEQLTRYVDLMRRDPLLGEVLGMFVAQRIKPQAKVLAEDRGLACVTVDYDVLRGFDNKEDRLF